MRKKLAISQTYLLRLQQGRFRKIQRKNRYKCMVLKTNILKYHLMPNDHNEEKAGEEQNYISVFVL